MRRYCRKHRLPFTTSFHTRFPEYISARLPVPESWIWAALRRFHGASQAVMAATPALAGELRARGFRNVVLWPRGVDTGLFHPRAADLGLPRPIFLCVGRVAVEKNLEAFLELDLPGTKVVVGDGPARAALARKYPKAVFPGARQGEELAKIYAAADVFVFPSKTDTFGLVLLEALASGLPVAAFPVTGPRDVIGAAPVGALNDDLRAACLSAMTISPQACREFAARHSWEASARAFVDNITDIRTVDPKARRGAIHRAASAVRGLIRLKRLAGMSDDAIQVAHDRIIPDFIRQLPQISMRPRACWQASRCERRCCRRRRSTNAPEPGCS